MDDIRAFWNCAYPETIPLSHQLKENYPQEWFRVHSLPESRRYPSDEKDWEILLDRQNTILTDLLGNNMPIILVVAEYYAEGYQELHPIAKVASIQSISFNKLEPIDLHLVDQELYEKGHTYTLMFAEQVWQRGKFNQILMDIAEDNLQALFVSVSNNCIIAPYDGGVNLFFKDASTRDLFKKKYSELLSKREDGL